jgi:hemerythrin-like domain-containing protein
VQTVTTLEEEHAAVLLVVTQLERAADAAARGVPVPAAIFADIVEFLRVFVDRCHHAKEETVLFPLLGGDGAALTERLRTEHEAGRQLAEQFAAAVRDYTRSGSGTAARLARAARAECDHLCAHVDLETRELLPLVGRTLSGEADAAAEHGFAQVEEQRIGPGTHERLHGMIEHLAPRLDEALGSVAEAER